MRLSVLLLIANVILKTVDYASCMLIFLSFQ